nr:MAG TPA: hypothetical protein [Caudoviricetes sp.]
MSRAGQKIGKSRARAGRSLVKRTTTRMRTGLSRAGLAARSWI